jgi:hypothetical protein
MDMGTMAKRTACMGDMARLIQPILIRAPKGHSQVGTYILEHRLVMEQHIGRFLEPTEVVHHIDENPSNNDIANLRLYSSQSEHISDAHGLASDD